MTEHLLIGLAGIVVLGIGAQWLAWRFRLPSILLLLLFGFLAGPVTGWLSPDELLGDLLFPLVSFSVAIILFEGGLTLRLRDLPKLGGVVSRLITVGALITWVTATVAAHYILGLGLELSILLGAILIVTGPTVIGPLLRQIRPRGQAGAVLKWEGILIDPVGAVLAVLVFEVIRTGELTRAPGFVLSGVLLTILVGLTLGLAGAGIMLLSFRRYLVPDYLQNGVSLLLVVATFALSNILQSESGLLTVTVMGVVLANQRLVAVKHIAEFKENLQVLLIGGLFIVLAARLQLRDVLSLGWASLLFLFVLIVISRPLTVLVSTWRSVLDWRQRLFMIWMAPRGIVAASVSSVFAFELAAIGYEGAEQLVSATFLVIVGTVLFYGLTAGPMGRWLGLSEQEPQGVLLVGAHPFARAIAAALQDQGFQAMLLDTNWENIRKGRMEGLVTHYGNALAEEVLEELDLTGIGRLLALTSNDEVNSLATILFPEVFSRSEVYQLPMGGRSLYRDNVPQPNYMHGRFLFTPEATYNHIAREMAAGAVIKATQLTEQFNYFDFQKEYGNKAIPLFLVTGRKKLIIYTVDYQPIPRPGQTLISLVRTDEPEDEDASQVAPEESEQALEDTYVVE